jgi:hypothetical protein
MGSKLIVSKINADSRLKSTLIMSPLMGEFIVVSISKIDRDFVLIL